MRAGALMLCALPLAAATHFVTVAGLGGEAEYEQRFESWAREVDKLSRAGGGVGRAEVLAGADATKARLQEVLGAVAAAGGPEDDFVLTLIGHGSMDGPDFKMQLRGPDITAVDLAALLDRIPARRQLVVVAASASGGALDALRKANRIVITATRSGTERNATVFARYWADALRDPAADTDKTETVTALEAFRYATTRTARFYETQKRLATEHALLEDTGTGEGARDPSPENGEGLEAARFALVRMGAAQAAARTPEKQKLLAKKDELERKIDQLKFQKAATPPEEYRKQLGALLLELARTQAEIDK